MSKRRFARRASGHAPSHESGVAVISVLLVLMALFVMSAPFLLTVRNADRASGQRVDRARARVALDAAERFARARLGSSHPGLDSTPYFDPADELDLTHAYPEDFYDPEDPTGVMWDIALSDVAGRIDLNSAPPQVIANLIGGVARLAEPIDSTAKSIKITSTDGFLEEGFAYLVGPEGWELFHYGSISDGAFQDLERGLGVQMDDEGSPLPCGPIPPSTEPLPLGSFVLDQRAFAIPMWRIASGELRALDSIEEIQDAEQFAMSEALGERAYNILKRTTSVHGGVRAGGAWQKPSRILEALGVDPGSRCGFQLTDGRWFSSGATVKITDGDTVEFGFISGAGAGRVTMLDPIEGVFEPNRAVISPMARRPVNVNTASEEVLLALITNLKLARSSARITRNEARQLVELIVDSRPFDGLEDLVRRVILPSAGLNELPGDARVVPGMQLLQEATETDSEGNKVLASIIDQDDAIALYKNALNANDVELAFSTMPFSFTTRDTYDMELRALVNAPSGVARAASVREITEMVVPQRDLLEVWASQERFDDHVRLEREAGGWLTGPEATARYDSWYRSDWPTRARAHLGPYDTQPAVDPLTLPEDTEPVLTFPDREENGWIQLAPARMHAIQNQTVRHFDNESRDIEGRYLPDGVIDGFRYGARRWVNGTDGGMRPMTFSMWFKPREIQEGALFLDVRGPYDDTDRVSLLFQEGNLVLRVLDGAGDHPIDPTGENFEEATEVRHSINEGAGIPVDTWSHVEVAVNGNRPDQVQMIVDGRMADDTPGLTYLTSGIGALAGTIPVDSTEGFPSRCVIRIGNELIEATVAGETAFSATHVFTGENAGFGGRLARELHGVNGGIEQNLGLSKDTSHPSGAAVQLYGYSLPIFGNVPASGGSLDASLGPFAVCRVSGIVRNGQEQMGLQMEPVRVRFPSQINGPVIVGYGMDSDEARDPEALILAPGDGDNSSGDLDHVAAFPENGGYAALLSVNNRFVSGLGEVSSTDEFGNRMGGVEVFFYNRREGNRLFIERRGSTVSGELGIAADSPVAGNSSFIFSYDLNVQTADELNSTLSRQVMVIPISIPVQASGFGGFAAPPEGSGVAQITRLGGEANLTEWVRYDQSVNGHLVRADVVALGEANFAAHGGLLEIEDDWNAPTPGGGGGGGPPGGTPGNGGSGGAGGAGILDPRGPVGPLALPGTPAVPQQTGGLSTWTDEMGTPEDDDYPVTRAVRSVFFFRGVMGTFSHAQPRGATVLPVWTIYERDETAGWPGRFDPVMFFDSSPASPGFPGLVQRAYRPFDHVVHSYQDGSDPLSSTSGPSASADDAVIRGLFYVGLQDRLSVPFAGAGGEDGMIDTRLVPRVTKYPSGERPRSVLAVSIGGPAGGGARGAASRVPSAIIDETVVGARVFAGGIAGDASIGAQLVLAQDFGEGQENLQVEPLLIRVMSGDQGTQSTVMVEPDLPTDGGLLRIGREIVFYDSYSAQGHTFHISGRGMLGTQELGHARGEGVTVLESWCATTLAANIDGSDSALPVLSTAQFPQEGTVLLQGAPGQSELVHYTRIFGGALDMPRASTRPGAMDEKGPGLFRGRYGTQQQGFDSGTPVVLFPVRYWDRWAERADAPELHYYQFDVDQPDAYWKYVFWQDQEAGFPGVELGVLARYHDGVPWDGDPTRDEELEVLWRGSTGGEPNPLGFQSDRVEFRTFVRYLPGAFTEDRTAHGWKTTPRMNLFAVEYMGPGLTLRRVTR